MRQCQIRLLTLYLPLLRYSSKLLLYNQVPIILQLRVRPRQARYKSLCSLKAQKMTDPIRGMAGQARFDVKKIFDLPLEITLGEFLDQSDITIKELAYNMQKITPRYRIHKAKPRNTSQEVPPATSSNAVLHPPTHHFFGL